MGILAWMAQYAGDICQILSCILLLVKPVREWLLGMEEMKEGQRCLLRAEIVRIYYRHGKDKQLREFEYQNLEKCYKGYKALGGNSFVDHIYGEMQAWQII